MNKILIPFMLLISSWSFATSPFEQESVDFSPLEAIEEVVEANPELDFETLKTNHPELLEGLEIHQEAALVDLQGDMPILGAFWWGCCLGIVGLLLTYIITDNDKAQVKSALIGCVISTILFGIGGFLDPFNWF